MKKNIKISNFIKKTAERATYNSNASACTWWQYQPKKPESLKRKR